MSPQALTPTQAAALPGIDQFIAWVAEAEMAHSDWRREAWQDSLFREGKQWSQAAFKKLIDKDINPLTINRCFPIINMITGNFALNQHDIVAAGRTMVDSEVSQVMSEALAFVMDQNYGYRRIYEAFNSQVLQGICHMAVERNNDPRQEVVKLRRYPWYSIWWDPFSDPWLEPETCKYVYYADWKDLDAVVRAFPDKRTLIKDHFEELTSTSTSNFSLTGTGLQDEGTQIEEKIRELASGSRWADKVRKRVRPVEMWYAVDTPTWFAVMEDGSAKSLDKIPTPQEQMSLVMASEQVVQATVRNIRVATFVGKVLLRDQPSPLPHDQYPFVPFVGYTDVLQQPFGVIRQIREQQMEVNKRRSMGLSLITNRRVIQEVGSSADPNKTYEEANRQDGNIVLNNGKMATFQIQEMGTMAPQQFDLQRQSEQEMMEIVGVNNEYAGYQTSGSQSNLALENKQNRAGAMTAGLMLNLKTSQRMLGERIIAHIQADWTGPKVLRVTDRVTGAEKFVELNKRFQDPQTGQIVVRNNVTQGRYDVVVSDKQMTDTMRQKNLDNIFSAIQKAPPEAIAPLLNLAFELSDLPNKAQLLHQLRTVLGVEPIDPLLTSAEADAKAKEKQQSLEQQRADEQQLARTERETAVSKMDAEIKKLLAEVQQMTTEAQAAPVKMAMEHQQKRDEAWLKGYELSQQIKQQQSMTKTKAMEPPK